MLIPYIYICCEYNYKNIKTCAYIERLNNFYYKTIAVTGLTNNTDWADTRNFSGMLQIKHSINLSNIIISTVDFENFNYSFITDNNMTPSGLVRVQKKPCPSVLYSIDLV